MNDIAVNAFLTTHLAAAAGMVTWMIVEMIRSPKGKVTAMGAACGLVAGLVAITPAAGYVSTPIFDPDRLWRLALVCVFAS